MEFVSVQFKTLFVFPMLSFLTPMPFNYFGCIGLYNGGIVVTIALVVCSMSLVIKKIFFCTVNHTPPTPSFFSLPHFRQDYSPMPKKKPCTHMCEQSRGLCDGAGVYIHVYMYIYKYILICYVCGPRKNFESYFSDRLIFSIVRSRTYHQIYRVALPLLSQKCFPYLVNQGISYIMCTLLYLSGWMTQLPAQTNR